MGAWGTISRRADTGSPFRVRRRLMRHTAVFCSGTDHHRTHPSRTGRFLLSVLVLSGTGRLHPAGSSLCARTCHVPQGHFFYFKKYPGTYPCQTSEAPFGNCHGHPQRTDETDYRGSGRKYGAASCTSSAGDDVKYTGSGLHFDLSVCP